MNIVSKIYHWYQYLYYRLYWWNLKTWGESDMPQYNALLGVTFLVYLNLFALIVFFGEMIGANVVNSIGNIYIAIVGVIGCTMNYFLFLYQKQYLQIAEKFSGESVKERRMKALLLWCYVVLSFILPFALL